MGGPIPMTGVLIRGEKLGHRHAERGTTCDNIDTRGEHNVITDRDWSDVPAAQECQQLPAPTGTQEKGILQILPQSFQEDPTLLTP